MVAEEYNKGDKYNENEYEGIVVIDDANHPVIFEDITWKRAQVVTKECCRALDKALRNMELSGCHDSDIEDGDHHQTLADFTTFKYVIYWAEYARENKGLFTKLTGDLPEEIFMESNSKSSAASSAKKKTNGGDVVEKAFKEMTKVEEKRCQIEEKKFEEYLKTTSVQRMCSLSTEIRTLEADKERLESRLYDLMGGTKRAVMVRQKEHRHRKKARGGSKLECPDTPESNVSLMDKIDRIDHHCSKIESQIDWS